MMQTSPSPDGDGDAEPAVPASSRTRGLNRSGLIFAVSAYLLWGILPLYFLLLAPSGPFEIVAMRIIFSLVFCALILTVTRKWRAFTKLLLQPRVSLAMALAGLLIFVNWQTYVIAALSSQIVEAALGYFINPIVTVFLGVFFLRERLRLVQWIAVGISVIAVVVLAVGHGSLPWIALTLAFSFGLYGLIKKRVGGGVDAVSGLTLETLWLMPVAVAELIWVGATTGITFGNSGATNAVLLVAAGAVTAIPLLFFAAAARRLPLIYLGFIQYFAPVIQFLFGVVIMREAMSFERWLGFGLVWVALIVLTTDMLVNARNARRQMGEIT